MAGTNPIATTPDEQFVVGESDMAFYSNYAGRCDCGAVLFCRSGRARATINQITCEIRRNTLFYILPGWMLLITECTGDFRVSFCAFSQELFSEAAFRLEPSFFRRLGSYPFYDPDRAVVRSIDAWFAMVSYTYADRNNIHRNTIMRNRLQNALLEIDDKWRRAPADRESRSLASSRQSELFQRFVVLVHEHVSCEREVAFYADRLWISARYLSTVVRASAHCSVKEFIDRAAVLEIKMLLRTTDFSVQEIAYRLRFPDQSYLGRYFKKHTGLSPTEFRSMPK